MMMVRMTNFKQYCRIWTVTTSLC